MLSSLSRPAARVALDSKENFSDKIAENNIVDAQTLNEVKSRIVRLSFNEDVKSLFWIVDNQVKDMVQNEYGDTPTAAHKLKTLKTNIMKGNTGNTFAAAGSSSESVDNSSHPDKEKLKEDVRDDSSSTGKTDDVSTISSSSFSRADLKAIIREELEEARQQSKAAADEPRKKTDARDDRMSNIPDDALEKEIQRRKLESQSKAVAKKMFEQQSQASSDS